jgi:small GTP-binding protein
MGTPPKPGMDEFFEWLIEEDDERGKDNQKEIVLVKKVCMLGDPAVGKTSLIRRFVYDVFDDKYIETIGAKVTKKKLRIQYVPTGQTFQLRMMIWDIAGQSALDFVKPSYYRDAEGAIVVTDLTRKSTLANVPKWANSLWDVTGQVPFVLVGNKNDIVKEREVTDMDLADMAAKYKVPYLKMSAKEGDFVETAFRGLGLALIQRYIEKKK